MAAISNQQLLHEAAQLQQSFASFEQSLPELPFQKQWHACEQIHKMEAQFDAFLSNVESSPSFQNHPSIEQTRTQLNRTLKTVSSIYAKIQDFTFWYDLVNNELGSIESRTDDELESILAPIQDIRANPNDDSINRAYQQLIEKTTAAFHSGQTSLNPANPLTDSLVEQLDSEKKILNETYQDVKGEFNRYLPFFEKLRKTSNDHPDLKEKNLTFIKLYTGTYQLITRVMSIHKATDWRGNLEPKLLKESREMTKSLADVIDRTNSV